MPRRDPQLTGTEAALVVADQDRKAALKKLGQLRQTADNAKKRAAKHQATFEKAIARAVTSKPRAADWYAHSGPLDAAQVRTACGLSTMQLHRIMERARR